MFEMEFLDAKINLFKWVYITQCYFFPVKQSRVHLIAMPKLYLLGRTENFVLDNGLYFVFSATLDNITDAYIKYNNPPYRQAQARQHVQMHITVIRIVPLLFCPTHGSWTRQSR